MRFGSGAGRGVVHSLDAPCKRHYASAFGIWLIRLDGGPSHRLRTASPEAQFDAAPAFSLYRKTAGLHSHDLGHAGIPIARHPLQSAYFVRIVISAGPYEVESVLCSQNFFSWVSMCSCSGR